MFPVVMIRRFTETSAKAAVGVNKIKLGLNERHEALLEGRIPVMTYEEAKGKTALAERFGQHGLNSAVDIRRLWPTVEEIERSNRMKLHRTADEARRLAERNEKEKTEKLARRAEEVDQNYKEWVKSLKNVQPVEKVAAPEPVVEEAKIEKTKPKKKYVKKR